MADHFIPPNAKFVAPDPELNEPKYSPDRSAERHFDSDKDFRRCKKCNGYGRALLWADRHCAHCRRTHNIKHDASSCKHIQAGYADISPSGDGGVLKKVVTLPPNPDNDTSITDHVPKEGCPVHVHLVGTLLNGEIFHTTRDLYNGKSIGGTDDTFEFHLLREKVIRGVDLAVASMIVGEVSSFVIRSDYGYNRCALPESLPKVKMNDTMIYEIELVSFGDAIPRFPSKEELDQTKKDRLEENKKFLEENPPVPYADRCSEAMKEKDLGNELFKKGDYEEAKKQYDSGFIHVYIHHDEWKSNMMNDEQRKMINDTKAILHLNRCMCRVKQEKWNDALWDADKAIEYGGKPGNPKAYYRRMVIYTGHFSRELAKEQDGKFWDIAKGQRWQRCARRDLTKCLELNKEQGEEGSDLQIHGEDAIVKRGRLELERFEKLLKRYESNYGKAQKKLYSEKMMGSLNKKYENMKIKKEERVKKEEEEMDMPELDEEEEEEEREPVLEADMMNLPIPPTN